MEEALDRQCCAGAGGRVLLVPLGPRADEGKACVDETDEDRAGGDVFGAMGKHGDDAIHGAAPRKAS